MLCRALTRNVLVVADSPIMVSQIQCYTDGVATEKATVKRPPTPYARYVQEMSPGLLKQNPGAKGPQLMRLVADSYREMSVDEREKRKAEYQRQLEAFKAEPENCEAENEAMKTYKKHRMMARRAGLPTPGATSSLAMYVAEQARDMKTGKKDGMVSIFKEITRKWKTLKPSDKEIYENQVKIAKEKAAKAIHEWAVAQKLPRPNASYRSIVEQYTAMKERNAKAAMKMKLAEMEKRKKEKLKEKSAKANKVEAAKSKKKTVSKTASKTATEK